MKIKHVISRCNQGHASLFGEVILKLEFRELCLLIQGFDDREESCNLNILY